MFSVCSITFVCKFKGLKRKKKKKLKEKKFSDMIFEFVNDVFIFPVSIIKFQYRPDGLIACHFCLKTGSNSHIFKI